MRFKRLLLLLTLCVILTGCAGLDASESAEIETMEEHPATGITAEAAEPLTMLVFPPDDVAPVSYTHLTLPTN